MKEEIIDLNNRFVQVEVEHTITTMESAGNGELRVVNSHLLNLA